MDSPSAAKRTSTFVQTAARAVHGVLVRFINQLLIFCIIGLRPLLGPARCRYEPSCGMYALKQLQKKSTFPALWAIIKRLLSCNPLW